MKERQVARLSETDAVEMRPGHMRSTLSYNDDLMLCHFEVKKDVIMPYHQHQASQIGYVLTGKIEFFNNDGVMFVVGPGDAYEFKPMEPHGGKILEDCTFIECFNPSRDEYK